MSEPAREMSINLFQATPGGLKADQPPGTATVLPTAAVEAVASSSGDEADYFADIFDAVRPFSEGVEAVRRVAWAENDRASPCYSHLLVDGSDTLNVPAHFELGAGEFDLLVAANRYAPLGHYDIVAFGLRGARLRGAAKFENVARLPLEDARPDHVHFQCVIGFYFTSLGKFSAYTASTVPWHEYMAAGKRNNLLPPGCYIYKKGEHHPSEAHRVNPALRLSDAESADSGVVTVLRTHGHPGFDFDSVWSIDTPSDNIHCAYSDAKFSSLGCQTIKGSMHDGLWADFQATLKTLPSAARVDYVLTTGAEAALAWSMLKGGQPPAEADLLRRLGRLRAGSHGEEVQRLQAALGVPVTGFFSATTKLKLTEVQAARGLPADGVFSPAMDVRLGWRVFEGSAAAAPAAVVATAAGVAAVEAVAPQDATTAGPLAGAGQPLAITHELISKIAPRPKKPEKAAIWDTYVTALTSPEGAAVMANYGVTTPQRQVFILANMMAETGGLSLIWESMGYSAKQLVKIFGHAAKISEDEAEGLAFKQHEIAERVYGLGNPRKAHELGNKDPGDGFKYRGGGFLQTTGRDNYRTLGQRIGEDLEGQPQLLENGLVSLKAACAEWQRSKLNDYADQGSFRACCNGINYGQPRRSGDPIGFDDRLSYLRSGLKAFGLPMPKRAPGALEQAHAGGLELGDMGAEVAGVQRDLNALDYDAGEADGAFTTRTRDAVLAFQARNGLEITGRVDDATRAALASPDAIPRSRDLGEARTQATQAEAVGARRVSEPKVETARGGRAAGLVISLIALLGLLVMLAASGIFGAEVTKMPIISIFAVSWFEPLAFAGWLFSLGIGLRRLVFRR